MSTTVQWGPVSIWHHRLLGGLWALCGCFMIANAIAVGSWAEYQFWLVSLVSSCYVAAAIGLIFGRRWARRAMAVLMVGAAVLFVDMVLMCGWVGNRSGMWMMLVALGIAVYTLAFLAVSARWHSQPLP